MSKDSGGATGQPLAARVGKYLMLEMLGEGAFGKVRLAVDETDGNQYAIKIMEKSHIKANELTLQVRREIAVMKAMRHPNIVNLHEVLTSSKNLYMVMDLVTGGELFDAVAEKGKLSESQARLYFQQLVDGVHYCHKRRVYHRDLKPENLLLSSDKQTIKITDFGLSSIKASNAANELLHTIMGSPHYIAPEIITNAAAGYDGAKVDVWASGIILFGMLAGYLPFDEPSMSELYRSIVRKPISFPPHFSYDVVKLLKAMLQKDPAKRPTMDDVRQFMWFKVNYRPAVPEQVVDSATSVLVPKKGKLRTRVKKAAAGRVRKKNVSADTTRRQEQPTASSEVITNPPPPPIQQAQPQTYQKQQQATKTGVHSNQPGPQQQVTSPVVGAHNSRTQSERITAQPAATELYDQPPPNQQYSYYHSPIATLEPSTPRARRNSREKDAYEMQRVRRLSLSDPRTSNLQDPTTPRHKHAQIDHRYQGPPQPYPDARQQVDDPETPRGNTDAVYTSKRSSGSCPKRPPALTDSIPSADREENNGAGLPFSLNARDLSNACESVDTPLPMDRLNQQERMVECPFSPQITSQEPKTDSFTKLQTSSTNSSITKKSQGPNSFREINEFRRLGSVDTNGTGGVMSSASSMQSRHELSGSSSGFRDGVKKVLENGLDALSTTVARSKIQVDIRKRSFQKLFSHHHTAEGQMHPKSSSSMPENEDVDSSSVKQMSTTENSRNSSMHGEHFYDYHLQPTKSPSGSQDCNIVETDQSQMEPHVPFKNHAEAEAELAQSLSDNQQQEQRIQETEVSPKTPEASAPVQKQISEQLSNFTSPVSLASDNALPQETGSHPSSSPATEENPFTFIADHEENENVMVDKELLNQCSPMTSSTNPSGSGKGGIFKPVRSVFKPLVKQLLPEEELISGADFGNLAANIQQGNAEEFGSVSGEWGMNQGDLFADVEEGESARCLHQDTNKKGIGAWKLLNDLRRGQSATINPNMNTGSIHASASYADIDREVTPRSGANREELAEKLGRAFAANQ